MNSFTSAEFITGIWHPKVPGYQVTLFSLRTLRERPHQMLPEQQNKEPTRMQCILKERYNSKQAYCSTIKWTTHMYTVELEILEWGANKGLVAMETQCVL